MAKVVKGQWVTINGTHVFIGANGRVAKGPKNMIGYTHTAAKSGSYKFTTDKKTHTGRGYIATPYSLKKGISSYKYSTTPHIPNKSEFRTKSGDLVLVNKGYRAGNLYVKADVIRKEPYNRKVVHASVYGNNRVNYTKFAKDLNSVFDSAINQSKGGK